MISLEDVLYREQDELLVKKQVNMFINEIKQIENKPLRIREGMIQNLFQSFGGGFLDAIKEQIIDTIIRALGVHPTTLLGEFTVEFVSEFIENVLLKNPGHIANYIGEGGCKLLAGDMVSVLGEAGSDIFARKMLKKILDSNVVSHEAGEEGSIGSEIMEKVKDAMGGEAIALAVGKTLKETFQNEILSALAPKIESAICELDFAELISPFKDINMADSFSGWMSGGEA